jgi:hypothetical protein
MEEIIWPHTDKNSGSQVQEYRQSLISKVLVAYIQGKKNICSLLSFIWNIHLMLLLAKMSSEYPFPHSTCLFTFIILTVQCCGDSVVDAWFGANFSILPFIKAFLIWIHWWLPRFKLSEDIPIFTTLAGFLCSMNSPMLNKAGDPMENISTFMLISHR